MTTQPISEQDPKVRAALEELKNLIWTKWPSATFEVSRGEDNPHAVHLDAIVDVDDTDEIMDLVIGRLLELQLDEGVPIHVIPTRPIARVVEELRREQASGRRGSKLVIVSV